MSLKNLWKISALALVTLLGAGSSLTSVHADTITYNINFGSLGALQGRSDYNLDFILGAQGNPNSSTTINVNNVNYGGGNGPANFGPLTDISAYEEITSAFTAGSSLSFDIVANFTPELSDPDTFSFIFFDNNQTNTSTSTTPTQGNATGGGQSYFSIVFDGTNPSVNTYAGTSPAFAAPTITVVATPEPATWAMMVIGMGAMLFIIGQRKRESADAL